MSIICTGAATIAARHPETRAEEIVEQGGSVYEVLAVLPHSDIKTAEIYMKKFRRAGLVKQAADRRAQRG
ncbi:MAG: hypothetical protein ABJN05_16085 [Sulfitobacter dubius]